MKKENKIWRVTKKAFRYFLPLSSGKPDPYLENKATIHNGSSRIITVIDPIFDYYFYSLKEVEPKIDFNPSNKIVWGLTSKV